MLAQQLADAIGYGTNRYDALLDRIVDRDLMWPPQSFFERREAARAMVEMTRACDHPRIVASHFLDNPASGRVLRKAGFLPTGKGGRHFSLARGYEAQTNGYALDLAEEVERSLPAAA